ncbi:MAG: FecR domain-containing protein, partial [Armatimonadetes bacterium]|nr:FecR domain-containing protein [Armatimonadota bacterium]
MNSPVKVTLRRIILLTIAALLVTLAWPAVAAPTAKITAIVLKVTHRPAGQDSFVKSYVGTQLAVDSRVRTGRRSKCEIKFPNGTVVRMAPRSELIIKSVTGRQVKLLSGQVLANVVKGSGAQIEGATATAAVRGTQMLFQGPTAPGVYPPREREQVSVWDGEAEFSTDVGSAMVGHQQQSGVGPSGAPGPASPSWPSSFPTGALTPWWEGIKGGVAVQSTPGTTAGADFKQQVIGSGQADLTANALTPTTGAIEVIVEGAGSAAASGSGGAAGLLLAAAPQALASLQSQPASAFGRNFYGPRSRLDVYGLLCNGGSFGGMRARASGIWGNNLYLEVGGQINSDLSEEWHTTLSEGFGLWRAGEFDIIAGRQHYLQGPVNNCSLGSLFSYTTFDGARLRYKGHDATVDLAWIDSYERVIIEGGEGGGALGRLRLPLYSGQIGFNYFHERGVGGGQSVDVSYPVRPGYLD